ncbi:MAG: hypothetical protein KGZ93_07745 [Actinobacteria bacterium]|jgi:hypothetical protein|nr:hypothetical protein [Actinomycetota bacterium]
MELPKWLEFTLFISAWLIALIRLRYAVKAYLSRGSIFGVGRRYSRVGFIANTGYAITAALLGVYFLLAYVDHNAATLFFGLGAGLLVIVAILELTFRSRDLKSG